MDSSSKMTRPLNERGLESLFGMFAKSDPGRFEVDEFVELIKSIRSKDGIVSSEDGSRFSCIINFNKSSETFIHFP